ncbi:Holliday junction resolvase RuvX [Crenobacter cavernae]|uniref:Putative pre-16S rRNA nuclease n=1 Tax=Crenobacter cavernae TaxID=2290923 RepID=A0A345Y3D7_9NEIS|nr:Holliday junction resolvase RuvX [Crenobacter cavernae]AXK38439.1 Holliday junction resolvase RuvX [Crenobacter cavernae]
MPDSTILGFDFGERRIGIAMGAAEVGVATPLVTIDTPSNDERFTAIAKLIAEWQPGALVVGLPTHADGTEHEMTRLSHKFAQRLKGRFALPVWLVDERHTSLLAESMLNDAGVRGRKQKTALDQVAAMAIVQTWFEAGGEAV